MPNALKSGLGIEPKRDHARFDGMLGVVAGALERLGKRLERGHPPAARLQHGPRGRRCGLRGPALAAARRERCTSPASPDPRLYKALLGQAALVVSSRMHPLILAAGMGVPFVGLSYNGKFDGLYDRLGLAARPLPLDLCPEAGVSATLDGGRRSGASIRRVELRQRRGARVHGPAHARSVALEARADACWRPPMPEAIADPDSHAPWQTPCSTSRCTAGTGA